MRNQSMLLQLMSSEDHSHWLVYRNLVNSSRFVHRKVLPTSSLTAETCKAAGNHSKMSDKNRVAAASSSSAVKIVKFGSDSFNRSFKFIIFFLRLFGIDLRRSSSVSIHSIIILVIGISFLCSNILANVAYFLLFFQPNSVISSATNYTIDSSSVSSGAVLGLVIEKTNIAVFVIGIHSVFLIMTQTRWANLWNVLQEIQMRSFIPVQFYSKTRKVVLIGMSYFIIVNTFPNTNYKIP